MSIVGSRHSTKYGEEIAYRTAYELAQCGVVIVSGMAYGIDACAHRGCLDAGGTTIAVLGTAIDNIYPAANRGLAQEILERGAIISEYPPGHETRNWHFLERNRLVSGLSDALLIVEASEKSGTLTTASLALDQGKDLFVVPGDITRPMSVGCNHLIRQGAYVFTETSDLLEILLPGFTAQKQLKLEGLSAAEQAVLRLLQSGLSRGEEIIAQVDFDAATLGMTLTNLELGGYIRSLGGDHWALI